jgi:glutathione S-transferase
MSQIRLYTHTISQSSEKIRWALDSAGISYEERVLPPFVHTQWANLPGGGLMATMPVLEADGLAITDSTRILEWLEANRAPFALIPSDPVQRELVMAAEARFDMAGVHLLRVVYRDLLARPELALRLWSLDANPLQEFALRLAFPLIRRLFERGLDASPAAYARSQRIVDRVITELDHAATLGQQFLVGDRLSVADITAAALLSPLACPDEHPVYSRRDYQKQMAGVLACYRDRPGLAWVRGLYRLRGVGLDQPCVRARGAPAWSPT